MICKKLALNKTTCLRVLHEDLGLRKLNLTWVPYKLSDSQMENRVYVSKELLGLLDKIPENKWNKILTGDESWFFYESPHKAAWAASRDELPNNPNRNFHQKKVLISIIWSVNGIVSLLALESGSRYNSTYFCDVQFPDMEAFLLSGTRKKTLRGYFLHLDNATSHNSQMSTLRIEDSINEESAASSL
jgi:hypothetical protein